MQIDGSTGSDSIADVFAQKYGEIYSSVSYNETDMHNTLQEIDSLIDEKCSKGMCGFGHSISVDSVKKAIKKLKCWQK